MTVLLVVAKAPVPGLAKTRLCPPATPRQAAAIAAAALLDTLDAVRATPDVTPVLAYAGSARPAAGSRGEWLTRAGGEWLTGAVRATELRAALAGWQLIPQRGATFGERLSNAHADATRRFPNRPLLQIGMDTPQVSPTGLATALRRLARADAVLGPAADGGWWALGLRDPRQAAALRDVPMSTTETGRLTRTALAARGLSIADLPALSDVDEWGDALTVAASVPHSRFAEAVERVNPVKPVPANGAAR